MVHDARIISDQEFMESPTRAYERPGFIYAHGKLEDDMHTDLFYLYLGDYHLQDGLVAYYKDKPVRFFLYRHPDMLRLTGIVAYCDDKEACLYGQNLVKERPDRF